MTIHANPTARRSQVEPGAPVLEGPASVPQRKASAGKLVFTILAALGVALALNVAVCFLPENSYQRWQLVQGYFDRPRWIYERIHYDPRPIDVVILGTSRSQTGFNTAAIEQDLAARGKHLNVVDFAIYRLGRNIEWAILNEVYKVKSPKVIVVEIFDPAFPFTHDLFKYVTPVGALVSAPVQAAPHQYFVDLTYLPIRELKLFCASLFPELFGMSKQFDPEAYARNRTDYTTSFTDEHGEIVNMEAIVPREVLLEQLRHGAPRDAWTASEYARLKGGEESAYLRRIAEEAKAHGAQLIFNYMPSFAESATPSRLDFLKQYGSVLNNGDLANRDELYENWAHLNHAGTAILSARLADAIAGLNF
jgi:hypothetical protein